jgi:hypothetical protein
MSASLVGFNLEGLSFAGLRCPLVFLENAVFEEVFFCELDFAITYFLGDKYFVSIKQNK